MGLFNKKKSAPPATSLDASTPNTPMKSETTTAVPSHSPSDVGSLERSAELETTVLDEKNNGNIGGTDTKKQDSQTPTTTPLEKHTVSTEIPETGEEAVQLHKTFSGNLQRTTSNSIISVPGADEGDEIVYPQGLKLALIILALCLSVFLVALDNTIIATAIPKITDHFKSLGDVGWYGSAYLLTTCALQLFFGKLYTFYSIKSVYLVSIVIFEIGSAVCGAAPSSSALIVGRAVAGIGSAGVFSGALIIIAYTVPLVKRPIYTGSKFPQIS